MTLVTFLRNTKVGSHPTPEFVGLAGWGETGPVAVAARALTGAAGDRLAVDTGGFRFGEILDYRAPGFLPGGSKYLDLPGMILLNGDLPLWVKGEGASPEGTAVEWLLQ